MAKKLSGLGRGLDSLFADNSVEEINSSCLLYTSDAADE
mgnify:CR=1 FL=1